MSHNRPSLRPLLLMAVLALGCAAQPQRPRTPDESSDLEEIDPILVSNSPEATAARRRARDREQRARDAERQRANEERKAQLWREKQARIEQELATGQCAQKHAHAFEEILIQNIPQAKRAMESEGPVDIGPKKVFVATDSPATFEFQASLGGLYNVFALGIDEVRITAAQDGAGDAVTAGSRYAMPALFVSPFIDSRVVRAQPFERLSISVAGRGCAMLVVMNQVGQ